MAAETGVAAACLGGGGGTPFESVVSISGRGDDCHNLQSEFFYRRLRESLTNGRFHHLILLKNKVLSVLLIVEHCHSFKSKCKM